MNLRRWATAVGVCAALLLLASCQVGVSRNEDGSLRVEGTMSEQAIQSEIERALADPFIEELQVDLRDGYLLIHGVRRRPTGAAVDEMSFRLDLGVADGHLTAAVSQAEIDGVPIDSRTVAAWNERIAGGLERGGQQTPNASLIEVRVRPAGVTMAWRVETPRSRAD